MESLETAINMEKDIERFYIDLALANETNSLMPVFLSLALDGATHVQILKDKHKGMNWPIEKEARTHYDDIFYNLVEFKFQKKDPALADQCLEALKKEHQSMEFHRKLFSESEEDREFLSFLTEKKKEHYDIIEAIILTVNIRNEWFQTAKFESCVACL
jgi:rubrerythrin